MAFSASQSEQNSGNRTLIVSFVELMENDQLVNRFSVRALRCKEFLEWLRNDDIPLAHEIVCVITEKRAVEGMERAVLPSS